MVFRGALGKDHPSIPALRRVLVAGRPHHSSTAEEAINRTEQMLNVYADFFEEVLAIPVVKGKKTDKEKFAGAEATYTIEALMHDGKALQSGTSHYFGDGFAKAFDIQFSDVDFVVAREIHDTDRMIFIDDGGNQPRPCLRDRRDTRISVADDRILQEQRLFDFVNSSREIQ